MSILDMLRGRQRQRRETAIDRFWTLAAEVAEVEAGSKKKSPSVDVIEAVLLELRRTAEDFQAAVAIAQELADARNLAGDFDDAQRVHREQLKAYAEAVNAYEESIRQGQIELRAMGGTRDKAGARFRRAQQARGQVRSLETRIAKDRDAALGVEREAGHARRAEPLEVGS